VPPIDHPIYRIQTVTFSALAMMIQPSVISILDLMILSTDRVRENTYERRPRIASMMTSEVPIQRYPHGTSQVAVRAIAVAKLIILFLSSCKDLLCFLIFCFSKNAIYTQAMIQERYMIDHMENVNPAGVTAVENIADISACVIPPMRYGEPGTLTRVVSPIVMRAVMRRRYRIRENYKSIQLLYLFS
jgi:hypothetical protein